MDKKAINRSFRKLVHQSGLSLTEFARLHNLPYRTLYNIYRTPRQPQFGTAKKIVDASDGKLTLADFGFEE